MTGKESKLSEEQREEARSVVTKKQLSARIRSILLSSSRAPSPPR